MNNQKQLEKIKEKMKERAKEIFSPAPPEIEEELKKETTLGNPKNLVSPDNKDE